MGNGPKRLWMVLACLACGVASAAERFQVPVTERNVAALPIGPAIEGALPRSLLLVKLGERGEHVGDPTVSSFHVYDPAFPEKGLRRIFSGPGDDQHLRFMTPLFGGYGVASGQLDPTKEPEGDESWFWFNLLEGKSGPKIEVDLWQRWMDQGWFVGEKFEEGKDGRTFSRIIRYEPIKGLVRTTEMEFSSIQWLGKSEVLGIAKRKEGERVLRLNVETSECEIIGELPPVSRPFTRDFRVALTGRDGCEGIHVIDGFSLWFQPSGGKWHSVIRDVHIVKTFGGAFPWLPVQDVGNGRFAVAKTVKDQVTPKEEDYFGAAEAVTMLIEGSTGKVLKQSEPYVYNHNPPLVIPDEWWEAGMKPKSDQVERKSSSSFHWDEKKRVLCFAGDKILQLSEDDEFRESNDGNHAVIYQKCPRGGGKEVTRVSLRIVDGKTGEIRSVEVQSKFYEAWVEVDWHVLCGASPDAETLRKFHQSGAQVE